VEQETDMRFLLANPISVRSSMAALALLATLAGCEDSAGTSPDGTPSAPRAAGATSVNRDIERPDVFSVSEPALWDGRPSLGGVWVAYPANVDPERVIIRNISNGNSVVGALFRRERENPGPKIQLSSDAAAALGIVAGSPTEISIVVLRREEVVVDVPEPAAVADENMTIPPRRAPQAVAVAAPIVAAPVTESAASFAAIVEQTLDDVAVPEAAETAVEAATVAPAPTGDLFRLRKPYIQIGTFAEEANADALLDSLTAAGVQAQTQANDPENPTLWRVISGPYAQRAERTAQLRIIKGLGYTDAFFFK
jgi:cell division septation protein DedD